VDRVKKLAACFLILLGCPRNIALTPIVDSPAPLPPEIAADMEKAAAKANGADVDSPPWRILGGHRAAGHLVEHYRLGRGLHLVLSIDRDAHALTHQLWFDARHLDPKAGTALLEMFRDRPGSARTRAYELAGGQVSAGISRELGFFAVTAPSELGDTDVLAAVVKLEAERLAKKEDANAAIARAVDLSDPRERVESVMLRAFEARIETGAPKELNAEGLRAAVATTFAPQRLVLVIAGDVDRTRALTLVREAHATRGAPSEVEAELPELRSSPPAFPIEVQIPADDRELLIGWTIDPKKHGLAMEAAAHVLAGGEPSRLSSRLGEGIAGIRARAPEGSRTIELTLILDAATTSTKAIGKVREELAAIAKGDSTAKEVERARDRMMRELLRKASGLESRGELFASAMLMAGSLAAIERRAAELKELSESSVRAAIEEEMTKRQPAMVLGVPEKEGGT
jgi:hypothetical protein